MPEEIEKYAKETGFFETLDSEEKEMILRLSSIRHYEAGSSIHSRTAECLGMIRMVKGSARTFMISPEGREITLYRMAEGETDVLSASCVISQIRFDTEIVAETDCDVFIIPAVCLKDLKESNPAVRCFIYERLAARFSDTVEVMQNMLFLRIDERIASWLLARIEESGTRQIQTTHEEIARGINSSREVVSRVLKEMDRQGIIQQKRGRILIPDIKKLKETVQR